jgi:hypothetical protein
LFSGKDLDNVQKLTAALVLYIMEMGVDARLATVAAEAGPNEVRWLNLGEAGDLRVTYDRAAYKPWHVEPWGCSGIH